jgi:hypothetical protein
MNSTDRDNAQVRQEAHHQRNNDWSAPDQQHRSGASRHAWAGHYCQAAPLDVTSKIDQGRKTDSLCSQKAEPRPSIAQFRGQVDRSSSMLAREWGDMVLII